MHTLKFNKKILLLLLYFLILSNNTVAGEYIAKLTDQIQFPTFTVFDSKEKPAILKLNDGSNKNGYVVNFWATWCVPCKKELPDLSLLDQKLEKYKIDVLTISIDKKNIKDQIIFLKKNDATNLTHYFDKKMDIFKAIKLRGVPTTILVDRTGLIVSKHEGILKWSEDLIVKEILNLLN
jgi:thiol-disulfide isomerase/thioredoxin